MLDVTRYLASAARRTRSVDAAAESLRKLRERIGPAEVGKPERLVVLTATGDAYERTYGVTSCPSQASAPSGAVRDLRIYSQGGWERGYGCHRRVSGMNWLQANQND